ncbi:hypothetical protein DFH07DRAFT_780047 [Mycena maculata]|uniref:Uncharacterized protein n=1 Tax=Mycena maculata TaxID=230809 RepID=A0AAD7I5A4_9AGAR|nr:hypothetical protein DFH07DRAFT_780047 [Mycena maculata]
MQTFPTAPAETEAHPSVPAVALTPDQQRSANAAALQLLSAAMASLTPGSQPTVQATQPTATVEVTTTVADGDTQPPPISPTPAPAPVGFQTHGPWVAGTLFLVVPTAPLMLIHEDPVADDAEAPLWYCITKGTYVGVHTSQALALTAVQGVRNSGMKSYKTQSLAVAAFNEMLAYRMVAIR